MKKKTIFIVLSLAAGGAVMAMPWRGLFIEKTVCLRASPEEPINKPEEKNNCPSYIYKALAIIPERKNIFSPGKVRLYRKASPDDQVVEKFFGKNKFSLPASKINQRRKV